jgi:hypothetical protein
MPQIQGGAEKSLHENGATAYLLSRMSQARRCWPNSQQSMTSVNGFGGNLRKDPNKILVRLAGLEPARVAPLPPQSSVSANSTISAHPRDCAATAFKSASRFFLAVLSDAGTTVGQSPRCATRRILSRSCRRGVSTRRGIARIPIGICQRFQRRGICASRPKPLLIRDPRRIEVRSRHFLPWFSLEMVIFRKAEKSSVDT